MGSHGWAKFAHRFILFNRLILMIKVVSWNLAKRQEPWAWLHEMGREGKADVALVQEASRWPRGNERPLQKGEEEFWDKDLYDRRCRVIPLSDRVQVEHFRQVPAGIGVSEDEVGVSGLGTIAVAKVIPNDSPENAFIAVSMYAQWIRVHPCTGKRYIVSADSAHRILSDLSTFIADTKYPTQHRILAAGDLNMFYGAIRRKLSDPERERTVWERFDALGLEFLGPQFPHGRKAISTQPDVPTDTRNVPTYRTARQSPQEANRQLDYAFASRGFHKRVKVCALNEVDKWGPSDHCRLLIEVADG